MDNRICIWNILESKCASFDFTFNYLKIAISDDGQTLIFARSSVTAQAEIVLYLWSDGNLKEFTRYCFENQESRVSLKNLSFVHNDQIVVAIFENRVIYWHTENPKKPVTEIITPYPIIAPIIGKDCILCGLQKPWYQNEKELKGEIKGREPEVPVRMDFFSGFTSGSYTITDGFIRGVTRFPDGRIRLWNQRTGRIHEVLALHYSLRGVDFSKSVITPSSLVNQLRSMGAKA